MRSTASWSRALVALGAAALVFGARGDPAYAIHFDDVELDGDAMDDSLVTGDDWDVINLFGGNALIWSGTIADEVPDNIYFTGDSKDIHCTCEWQWTTGTVPDKDDLQNAYVAAYPGEHLYFGADRYANTGDSQLGFWFFKDNVAPLPDGTFSGFHTDGDILVLSDFVNGGHVANLNVYRWSASLMTVELIASGVDCADSPHDAVVCAMINQAEVASPWPYTPKSGTPGFFPVGSFLEGAVELEALGGDFGCFTSYLVETRSSASVDAVLKDFISGQFETCSLDVDKSGTTLSKVGDPATYTFTFTNTGIRTLYLESVTDSVLGDLTTAAADAGCATLAPTETCYFDAERVVQPGDPDPLVNTVTAVYNIAADLTSESVLGTAEHAVNLFQPAIGIDKTGPALGHAGQEVVYDFTITNLSSEDSPDLLLASVVDDHLGDLTSLASATCGTLATGASCTFSATGTLPAAPDPFVNTVDVLYHPSGFPNDIADWDMHAVNLFQVGLELTKSGDALSKIGDPVTYTFEVTNTSSEDAPSLVLTSATDDVLGDLAPAAIAAGCEVLDSGQSCAFTATRVVGPDDPDPLVNTATATYTAQGFTATATGSGSHSVNLFQPSVALFKAGDLIGEVGAPVAYVMTVENTSSGDSPDLLLDSFTDSLLGDLAAAAAAAGCDRLAPGGSCSFDVSRVVLPDDPDPLPNTAVVHFHPEGFPNDITDSDDHSVDLFQPSVALDKSGTTLSKIGDPVTYSFVVTNTSSGDAPPLMLQSFVDSVLGDLTPYAASAGCDVLGVGESCAFDVTHAVPADAPDPFVDTATVTFWPTGFALDVTASDSHSVNLFQPAVALDKSGDTLGQVGATVTYLFSVTHTGSEDSPDLLLVSLTDSLLGDLTGDAALAGCDRLAVGASCSFRVAREILPGDPDPLPNTAVVHLHPEGFDNDITDSDDHSVNLFQPGLTLSKTGTTLSKIGDPVTYTFEVANTSSADSPPLILSTFDDTVLGDLAPAAIAAGCNRLELGQSCGFSLTRAVPADAPDPLVNVATATYEPEVVKLGLAPVTVSASDSHTVNLFQPSVALDKQGDLIGEVGMPVEYVFTVTNASSGDSPDLLLDSFTDSLLGDLAAGASVAGCARLAPKTSCTFTLARVVLPDDPDPLPNTAAVHYHPEGFPNDITASDAHSVNLFQPSVTLSKTGTTLSKIGDPATYHFEVTNTSSADTPPLTLRSFVDSVIGDLTASAAAVGCDTLDVGESCAFDVTLPVPADAPDPYVDTATVVFWPTGFAQDVSASDSHSVNLFQPAVTLTKGGDALAQVGNVVTYVFTVTNESSEDSPDLVLFGFSDSLLGNLTTPALASGCWRLASGASCTFTVEREVLPGDPDPLPNTAVIHYHPDGFDNDITDSDDHSVNLFQPSITLSKTGTALSKIGDPVTYTFEVTNTSSADSPPLVLVAYTDSVLGDLAPAATAAGCDRLELGQSCAFSVTHDVAAGAPDPLVNVATATYAPEIIKLGLTPIAVSATDEHSVNLFQPSVTLTKEGDAFGEVGLPVTYAFTVLNTSSGDSPDLLLDSFADSLLGDLAPAAIAAGCERLAPGASCNFKAERVVAADDPDPLPNTAVVHFHPEGFPNDITDGDDHVVNLFQPSVTLSKTGTTLSKIGDPATYHFEVTNTSSADTPPLEMRSFVDSVLGNILDEADLAGCALLSVGESCAFDITHTIPAGAPDPFVDTATVVFWPSEFPLDVTASDSHGVNLFQPSIWVDKTGDALAQVGNVVTYFFTVGNDGSEDSPDLLLVSYGDTLLGDLTAEAEAAGCDRLPVGVACTFSAQREILAGDPDPLPNTAVVHYHPEGFENDITDSDDHSVNLFQPSLTLDKSGDTLSKIGDPVTYDFEVTNTSSDDAPPLLLVAFDDSVLGDLAPAAIAAGCERLELGQSCAFSVTRTVGPDDPDPLVNVATATYEPEAIKVGLTPIAVSASDEHSVNLFQPSVLLDKSGDAFGEVGLPVGYVFTVMNTSSDDSPDLLLESFSDSLLGDLATPAVASGCVRLAPGASCSFSVQRTVTADDPDPLPNLAVVHYFPEGFPNDITDSDDHVVNLFQPSVTLSKTGTTLSKIGDPATYHFEVTNTSSDDSPPLEMRSFVDSVLGDILDEADLAGCALLFAGDSCAFDITHTVPAGAPDPFVDTATVTFWPAGFALDVSASDSHSVNLFQPAVTLTKSGDALAQVGSLVTYTFEVTNTGSEDSPELLLDSVTDSLLGDLAPAAIAGGCDPLPVGASCNFTATREVLPGDPDPLPNTAVVHYHPAGFTNDITARDDHGVNLFQPSLTLSKSGDTLSKIGDPVTYDFEVTNTSSDDAPPLVLVAIDDSVIGDLAPAALAAGCERLDVGQSCAFSVTRTVGPDDPDPLVNVATATYAPDFDLAPIAVSASDEHSVNLFQPRVQLDKTGDAFGEIGLPVGYAFTVVNMSSDDSPDLLLDSFADSLLGDLASDAIAAGCERLAPGASCSFVVERVVAADDPDPLPNVAEVHYHPEGFPNDITDSDDHSVNLFQPSVTLSKTGTTLSKIGDPATYHFEVTNTSSDDTPPLEMRSFVDSVLGNILDEADLAGCALLSVGESCAFDITHTVPAGAPDPFVDTATVVFWPSEFPLDVSATDSHSVNLFQPAVTLDKTGDELAQVGNVVTYAFEVTNTGSEDSPDLLLVSFDDTLLGDLAATADAAGCTRLAVGQGCSFTVQREILASDPDPLPNTAVVHFHPEGFDNDITDSDRHSVNVFQPSITLSKTGTTLSKIGDPATYTFEVTNTSSDDSPPLLLVAFDDSVIGDLAPAALTAGCDRLEVGASCAFDVTRVVGPDDPDPLVNIATATYEPEIIKPSLTPIAVSASDEHSVNLFQPAVLLDKSGDAFGEIGLPVGYVFTVMNMSSDDSPDLLLDSFADSLLGDLAPAALSAGCERLAPGASCSFAVERVVAADDPDPLPNVAIVHYHPEGFPNDITDGDDHVVNLFQPSAVLSKTGTTLSKIGDPATYRFEVTNTSSDDSPPLVIQAFTDSVLGDLLPYAVAAGCELLDVGQSCAFEVTHTVPAGAPDPFVDTATVTFWPLGFALDVTASDSHAVNLFQPAVTLEKGGDTLAQVGNVVTYTFRATNTGSEDSPDLLLVSFGDTLLGDLTAEALAAGCERLPVGESCGFTAQREVLPGDPDPLPNTAVVHFHPEGFDNDITDGDDHLVELFQPGLTLSKTGTTLSKIGDPVTYDFEVTNTSSDDSPALLLVAFDDSVLGDLAPAALAAGCERLEHGASCAFSVTRVVGPDDPDPLVNVATATYEPDMSQLGLAPIAISASDTHSVNLFQPSVALAKDGDLIGEVGMPVGYVFTVVNTSSADSPDLLLDSFGDSLLGDLAAGAVAAGCERLAPGASCSFGAERVVAADDPDPLPNLAVVHYHPEGFPNDITAADDHLVNLFQPSVTLSKTGTTLSKIGDPVTYTFALMNTSSDDSPPLVIQAFTDSVLGDLLPYAVAAGCEILDAGQTCEFEVTHLVPPDAPDPFVDTATVIFWPLGFALDVSASDSHSVNLFQPSVSLDKGGDELAQVGNVATYWFNVTNDGSADSPDLLLDSFTDSLLGDLTPAALAAGCGALPVGASCGFEVQREILAGDPDPLPNTAVVHYHPGGFPNDITDTDDHSVNLFQPGLALSKTGDALSKIGDPVTYAFTVTNTSSIDSPALLLESYVDSVIGDLAPDAIAAGCDRLEYGQSCAFSVTRVIGPDDPDPLVNVATATYAPEIIKASLTPIAVSASDTHSVNLFQPSVTLDKSGDPLAEVGAEVVYVLTVTNTSSADSPDLLLDSFDDSLLGDIAPIAAAAGCARLPAGASCTFDTARTVQPGDPDPLPNTAVVHLHPEGFPNDITAGDSHVVELFQPSVVLFKAGDLLSKRGDDVTWTFQIQNTGSADSPDLTLASMSDTILGDITAEAEAAGCGALAVGQSCSFEITGLVQPDDPDPLVNVATVLYHPVGFASDVASTDDHSVNLFQPSIALDLTGDTYSKHGDTAHYTVTVTNESSADSPNLTCTLVDPILGLTGEPFNFGPGDVYVVEAEHVVVEPPDTDPLVNETTLECHVDGFPNVLTTVGSWTVDLVHPELSVTKSCLESPVPAGASANFLITVENLGDVPLIAHIVDELLDIDEVVTLGVIPEGGCTADPYPQDGCYAIEAGVIATGTEVRNEVTVTATLPAMYGLDNVLTETANALCEVQSGATRTQGFWQTHTDYTCHVFNDHLDRFIDLGWITLASCEEVFGVFWSNNAKESTGKKRDKVCKARVQASGQLLAAILNAALDNGEPPPIDPETGLDIVTAAQYAMADGDRREILRLASLLDAYNQLGDGVAIIDEDGTLIGHASPRDARSMADLTAADCD